MQVRIDQSSRGFGLIRPIVGKLIHTLSCSSLFVGKNATIPSTPLRSFARLCLVATMVVGWTSCSQAAFFQSTLVFNLQLRFYSPVLPPVGYTLFCMRYPDDCKVHGLDFRRRNIKLTELRWSELNTVNTEINRGIVPESVTDAGPLEWTIAPQAGDCTDYATTKRHQLLMLGWPSRALLLAEVMLPSGAHHLVLVVRTTQMDLVLDNLDPNIRMPAMTYRRWFRIETPQNPRLWARAQLSSISDGDGNPQ